jgi:hypothetical protein
MERSGMLPKKQVQRTQMSELEKVHESQMRPWIDLIDKLRALGCNNDTPLPMVCGYACMCVDTV